MKDVVYVADLDQDIDDVIAIEHLDGEGRLKYVVLDRKSESALVEERMNEMIKKGIRFKEEIDDEEKIVFVGGALTKVQTFLKRKKHNGLDILIMNGGFVGENVVPIFEQLSKFKHKKFAPTYNFNSDIRSTEFVLKTPKIERICLIGKNVCHHPKNSKKGIWKEYGFSTDVPMKKRMHDLLMVSEGLSIIDGKENELLLVYEKIKVVKQEMEGNKKPSWGSENSNSSNVSAATYWRK